MSSNNDQLAARQQVRVLDRPPARKLHFGAAALTHAWPSDRRLATVPADLAADHAPSIALPVRVPLVALATKLFRISRKHRLNGRSPRAGGARRAEREEG